MRDFFGNLLSEGDYVIYPHKVADCLYMTVRFVTRVDAGQKKVWSVSAERSYRGAWDLTHGGKRTLVNRTETMVRVPRESVPDAARALLNPEEFL